MMYPFMTLNDETEIVHSDMQNDGRVKVYIERPDEKYFEISPKLKEMPKLVDGNEIMQILNLKPSPKLKEIIDEIKELQLEGKINTKEDAINFLKNYKL